MSHNDVDIIIMIPSQSFDHFIEEVEADLYDVVVTGVLFVDAQVFVFLLIVE